MEKTTFSIKRAKQIYKQKFFMETSIHFAFSAGRDSQKNKCIRLENRANLPYNQS